MIKVEVTEEFTLKDFYKIKDSLVRKARAKDGWLYVGDTFECDEDMMKYLTGDNALNKVVVKVVEVIPENNVVTKVEFLKEAEPSLKITNVEENVKPTKKSKKKKK